MFFHDLHQIIKQEQQEIHSNNFKVLSEMLNLKVKLMSQRKIRKNHEKLGKGEGKGSNKRQLLEY